MSILRSNGHRLRIDPWLNESYSRALFTSPYLEIPVNSNDGVHQAIVDSYGLLTKSTSPKSFAVGESDSEVLVSVFKNLKLTLSVKCEPGKVVAAAFISKPTKENYEQI